MLSTFFGTHDVIARGGEAAVRPPAGSAAGEAPRLRVLPGGWQPPGTAWVEVDPFLAAGLAARGLPARFRVRPGRVTYDLPKGEPLLTLEDGWGRHTIACRTEDGEVVLGFDPDEAVARTLAETGRAAEVVAAGARRSYRPSPLRVLTGRLGSRLFARRERAAPARLEESADALRFACWLLLEEAAAAGDRLSPRPFWPHSARMALVVTHEVEDQHGLVVLERLRLGGDRAARVGTYLLGSALVRRGGASAARMLVSEGVEIGLFEPTDDIRGALAAGDLVPEAYAVRLAPALRHEAALAALARRFPVSSSVPDDDGQGGGCGSVFPYLAPSGAVEVPVTLPSDFDLLRLGLDAGQALRVWRDRIEAIRRTGGVAVLPLRPEPHLWGGDEELQAAVEHLLEDLEPDPEVWTTSLEAVGDWWRDRAAPVKETATLAAAK